MSNYPELDKYVGDSRNNGMPDDQIRSELLKIGWQEADVESALPTSLPSEIIKEDVVSAIPVSAENETRLSQTLISYKKGLLIGIVTLVGLAIIASIGYFLANPCPSNYLLIPGNESLFTKDFCVAQYEMRNKNGIPVSEPHGMPWSATSRNQSLSLCSSLGSGYHLISNSEWQTIARNIESVPDNWSGREIGKGFINIGNFASEFGGVVVDNACATEGFNISHPHCLDNDSPDFVRKRFHVLSTGKIIWDIGGNAFEWVSTDVSPNVPGDARAPICRLQGIYKQNFGPSGSYQDSCGDKNTDGLGCLEGEGGTVIFRGGQSGMENSAWQTCPGIFYTNTNAYWDANTVNPAAPGLRCVLSLD